MDATVLLKGNLIRDPMLVAGETPKCNFTVAVTTNQKTEDGKRVYNYYDCTSYGKPAVTMMNIGQKGTNVTIVGELILTEFKNKDDVDRHRLSVSVMKCDYNARMKTVEGTKTEEEKPEQDG